MTGFSEVDRKEILEFWTEKFGVEPDIFEGYRFYKKGESKVWIHSDEEPIELYGYEAVGLPFLRVGGDHPKPTTDALQLFGEYASRNVIELGRAEAKKFVSGETVEKEFDVDSLGYVVVTYDDEVLGCGLYFPGELRSQVPKGRRVAVNL